MRPDGSHPITAADGLLAADLDWSPDGRYVIFRNAGAQVGLVAFNRGR